MKKPPVKDTCCKRGRFWYNRNMSKKVAERVFITEKQRDQLKELNERFKIPVSELIRQGVDLILRKYDGRLSGQISLPLEKEGEEDGS